MKHDQCQSTTFDCSKLKVSKVWILKCQMIFWFNERCTWDSVCLSALWWLQSQQGNAEHVSLNVFRCIAFELTWNLKPHWLTCGLEPHSFCWNFFELESINSQLESLKLWNQRKFQDWIFKSLTFTDFFCFQSIPWCYYQRYFFDP